MKKLHLILLCLPFIGFGQGWEKNLELSPIPSKTYSVQQATDGGYILSGDGLNGAVMMIKTNTQGDTLWTKMFEDPTKYRVGYHIEKTTDGGYIICGTSSEPPAQLFDVYIVKTDINGDIQWEKTIITNGNESAYCIQQTTDGGYIISGSKWIDVSLAHDFYLLKIDAQGNVVWVNSFPHAGNGMTMIRDIAHSVKQTIDGGYIMAGYINSGDIYIVKTDNNGDMQWTRTFGAAGEENAYSIQQTIDGGYVICGNTSSFGTGTDDVYLIKINSSGNLEWQQTFGDNGFDVGYDVQQTSDGGYIICGQTSSFGTGTDDVYIIKTDINGNQIWYQTFGSLGDDKARSIKQTSDGGYIICGYSNSFSSTWHTPYLIKTDATGSITSAFNIQINTNRKLEKTVDILGRETKETNQPLLYLYDDGTVEKRIVIE